MRPHRSRRSRGSRRNPRQHLRRRIFLLLRLALRGRGDRWAWGCLCRRLLRSLSLSLSLRQGLRPWAGGRSEREEEEGGDREHAGRGHGIVVARAATLRKCTHRICARAAVCMLVIAGALCRRRHGHRHVIVAKPLDRLGAGWNGLRGLRGRCGLLGLQSLVGERWSRGWERKARPGRRRERLQPKTCALLFLWGEMRGRFARKRKSIHTSFFGFLRSSGWQSVP